ncbi:MAG: hypothetical protein FD131_384 [Rhodocyclaceae bacterium]|nr:MAG: hypothetical protein FD131_384 [Rhodocyclaceae bacterium]
MENTISKYVKWHVLNVGLPAAAAVFTYFFAYLTSNQKDVDSVLIKAFQGADNLVVAAIMFVVLHYETDELIDRSSVRWLHDLLKALFFVLALAFAVFFGAFKFHSFTNNPEATLNYAGASISIAALFSACIFATVVKAGIMIHLNWGKNNVI